MAEDGMGASSKAEGQPSGVVARVFISYASQDADTANQICRSLESHGITCWIAPRDVKPGAEYADAIVHAISDAKAIVLVMSAGAVASAHVGREIERAASKRKSIIAFRIDTAALNAALEYFLSQSQWIDVPALGIEAALAKVAEAVGGSSPSPVIPTSNSIAHKRIAKRAVMVFAILIGLGAALAAGFRFWPWGRSTPQQLAVSTISDRSIAVLPFADMSEKKDQEYFGDGMAEEIIDLLVKDPGLKVIGRTSSFQFKGQTQDLRAIGEKLHARYLLEGSVRKSGDRLRVTAQLIDSRDGAHLWSQTYDRELRDVLKMQDEIAIKVAHALQAEVFVRDFISRPALRSTEAYTLSLKAWHAADRYERDGWEQARSAQQRALELDPSFAEAALWLAGLDEFGGLVGYMPPMVAFEQARQSAERAIKLDPQLANAYAILGDIHNVYDWDWAAADREIKQALALAPNNPNVLQSAAVHSLTQGRLEEALKFINSAVDLDPLDPGGYFNLNLVQLRRGRLAEAEAAIHRTLELAPTFAFGQFQLGYTLLARNEPNEALAEFLKEPIDAARIGGSARAYFALGRKSESDSALAETLKSYSNWPSGIAAVYAYRGEFKEAFKWLDRAYAQKDSILYRITYSLEFDNLHGDPRYKAFLKKMNLPEG